MRSIGDFLTYAVIAVFAQNIVFGGTGSISMILYAARKPERMVRLSLLVSMFALLGSLTVLPFDYIAPIWSSFTPVRGLLLGVAVVVWYSIVSAICKRGDVRTRRRSLVEYLPTAALNGGVLAMPLLLDVNGISDPALVCGLSCGCGVGFALAVWLVAGGLRRADNPSMPKMFRGTPIMLIYIGLLALAFSAFGGAKSLFPDLI